MSVSVQRRVAHVLLHWGLAAVVFFALISSSLGGGGLQDAAELALTLTTAGVFGGGAHSWVLAATPDVRSIVGFCAEVAVALLYLATGTRPTRWVLTLLVGVRVAYVSWILVITLSGV